RRLAVDEPLAVTVSVSATREVRHGLEFDLVTKMTDRSGQRVWEETGTLLARRRRRRTRSAGDTTATVPRATPSAHHKRLQIAADIGRRYAFVAGDFNPIHLSAYTARLFGFDHAIATGMWLKARVAAVLMPQLSAP